ncbi:S-layer homology domain-containing protein [Saccharibacillus qingshengii]|uniref:S-layer homology domain-containing protein n=1 Tax=Saccharibacillus qingshengii TaxID=1763540 RepID=UPI001554D689
MKKKLTRNKLAFSAAAAVLFAALAGGQAYAAAPFGDLQGIPEASQIVTLREAGLLNGSPDGRFNPHDPLTNAQAIRLAVDTFKLNMDDIQFIRKPEASDYFSKASDKAWYADTLIIAAYNDLDLPKDLDPNAPATRSSFASLLILAGHQQAALPVFRLSPVEIKDESAIPEGRSGLMQQALVFDMLDLDADGRIRPNEPLTRAAAADILYGAALSASLIEAE